MSRRPARRRHKEEAGVQEFDEGGGAPPNVRTTNITVSSQSVVADLTDEHYLDARDLEALLRADEESASDQDSVVSAPPRSAPSPNGVAQPVEREPLIGPTGRPWPD